ncbi:MAG: AarF/ABC1/UbiB kinase family protein [Candidatus Nanoarchaeia archaeon]|nr:AarF/ABC1/UbiB kinase family protein [Candidatus Nanoarchaeia archaeon]
MGVIRAVKDLNRLKKIVNVLFSYELGNLVYNLGLTKHLAFRRRLQHKNLLNKTEFIAVKLRESMEELSGAFVKLGQLLSLRPDLIPKEYCDEFSKLQDNLEPFNYIYVKRIIEDELKRPLSKVFSSFDKEPIASASIGQVHKAKLISGEIVAVKVQRPHIEEIFETDLDLLYHLAHLAEKKIPELRQYDLNVIIKEFEDYTKKELNYIVEAKNIDDFYNNFKQNINIKIPRVFWEFTTKKVLTMEFIDGEKITEIKKLTEERKKRIIKLLTESLIHQVIDFRIFHADPHPGNILLLEKDRIAFLDFGIVGRLNEELIERIENVMIGLIKPDKNILAKALIELGFVKDGVPVDEFKEDLSHYLSSYYNLDESRIDLSSALYDILTLSRKYKMKMPTSFVLLVKSIATTEGLVRNLDPEYNLVKALRPEISKIIKKRATGKFAFIKLKKEVDEFTENVREIPKDVREALKNIKDGKIRVDINNNDINKFTLELDRSSNRLTFGVVIAALLVSSALVMVADLPPLYLGIPILGIIFFILAILFTLALLISIIREKRGEKYEETN